MFRSWMNQCVWNELVDDDSMNPSLRPSWKSQWKPHIGIERLLIYWKKWPSLVACVQGDVLQIENNPAKGVWR